MSVRKSERKSLREMRSNRQLVSNTFNKWLDEVIFELDGASFSRRNVAEITDTPCTNAAAILHRARKRMRINSLDRLYDVGLAGLMRISGVGERAAWIAACVLYFEGYNINVWTGQERRGARTTRGAIRIVHAQTRLQKHA